MHFIIFVFIFKITFIKTTYSDAFFLSLHFQLFFVTELQFALDSNVDLSAYFCIYLNWIWPNIPEHSYTYRVRHYVMLYEYAYFYECVIFFFIKCYTYFYFFVVICLYVYTYIRICVFM